MYYLVDCNTFECVSLYVFVGISDNKNGVFELLYNFYKQNYDFTKKFEFEKSHLDPQIYKITEEDYNYLLENIKKKETKIQKALNDFKPECEQSDYVFVIFDSDGIPDKIFNKSFHKKYKEILHRANAFFI